MPSVLRLCKRAIFFYTGKLIADGAAHDTVREYLTSGMGSTAEHIWQRIDEGPGDTTARLHAVRVRNKEGSIVDFHRH